MWNRVLENVYRKTDDFCINQFGVRPSRVYFEIEMTDEEKVKRGKKRFIVFLYMAILLIIFIWMLLRG